MGGVTAFDRLFDKTSPLIQQGLHERDSPLVDGGRWGVSVVLRPDHASAVKLERTMAEVEGLVGPGHFLTGMAGSAHFTVRVLEAYRESAGEEDEAVQRYARAMSRAARQVEAIELDLVGLTLAPGSVMACAHPVDDNADKLMDLLKDELAGDAWREAAAHPGGRLPRRLRGSRPRARRLRGQRGSPQQDLRAALTTQPQLDCRTPWSGPVALAR
jgi:hypothetical protein